MKNILYILIVVLFTSFNVGSGTAILKCKSASGRTEFYAEIENIEGILEKAILKIDDTSLEYKTEEANIIFDPENGVFTMFIDDFENKGNLSHKYLQFWAIPSSF